MPDLKTDVVGLLNSDSSKDLSFICRDGEIVQVHSLILIARGCRNLETLTKAAGRIEVEEFSASAVHQFVTFIYTDAVKFHTDSDLLSEILDLSDKFSVHSLKEKIYSHLYDLVSVENVLDLGKLIIKCKNTEFAQKCVEIISDNLDIFPPEKLDDFQLPASVLKRCIDKAVRSSTHTSKESKSIKIVAYNREKNLVGSSVVGKSSLADVNVKSSLSSSTREPSSLVEGRSIRDWVSLDSRANWPKVLPTDFYQLGMAKSRRKAFGVYADPLSPGIEYPNFNIFFEEGVPAKFWLHINTTAVVQFQKQIQRFLAGASSVGEQGGGFECFHVGSLVLARYGVDGQVYRAKVETVGRAGLTVRYIDYGNSASINSCADLYPWDPLLEFIPPQAVLCAFFNAPSDFASLLRLTQEAQREFKSLMAGKKKVAVKQRLSIIPLAMFNQTTCSSSEPEVKVSLINRDGTDVLHMMAKSKEFQKYFDSNIDQMNNPGVVQGNRNANIPSPVHLVNEPFVPVTLDEDQVHMADIAPKVPDLNIWKVQNWLNNHVDGVEEDGPLSVAKKSSNGGKGVAELVEGPSILESIDQVKIKDESDYSDSVVCLDDDLQCGICRVAVEPGKIYRSLNSKDFKLCLQCHQEEVFSNQVKSQQLEYSVKIAQLEMPADVQLSACQVSHVESPHLFHILPLLPQIARLVELEEDLMTIQRLPSIRVQVNVGSVYAVFHEDYWLRVRIEAVSENEDCRIRGQSIDYGYSLSNLASSSLFPLPDGVSRSLPGLAVQCSLSQIKPKDGDVWSPEASQLLRELTDPEVVVEASGLSIGNGNMNVGDLRETTNNLSMCESLVYLNEADIVRNSDLTLWDPMRKAYKTTANNYLLADDDLEVATDGYKSRGKVCAFFSNHGHCFKGSFCPDRHSELRKGAITNDMEETIAELGQQELTLPINRAGVVVKVANIVSPSLFYVSIPHGLKNLNLISEADLTREKSIQFSTFEENLQKSYAGPSKRYLLSSLPSIGEVLVCKSGVAGKWCRVKVQSPDQALEGSASDCSEDLESLRVFLLDYGVTEVVSLHQLRKLEPAFAVLPSQLLACSLDQIRPSGVFWSKESVDYFTSTIKQSPILIARLPSSVSSITPLPVVLQSLGQLSEGEGRDVAELLVEEGHADRGGINILSTIMPG